MKHITEILHWAKRGLIRYQYIFGSITLLFVITWFFCLPPQLFQKPTSTVILDKNGQLLGATISEDGQWRFPYNSDVPYKFKQSIIQFEDRTFHSHWGISIRGIARAIAQNTKKGKKVSGGSTLTMQLMRMSREKESRSVWQKVIEVFWATRAEWKYSKEELLSLYASNAPMGGNVVGLDAAAWRYFGRKPSELSWAESATLAVLPNAPSLMHPGKNRELLRAKRNRLLNRLLAVNEIDSLTWKLAILEELPDKPHPIPRQAPQFLTRVINDGYKGTVVNSSIDINIQTQVNNIVEFHHKTLKENGIFNAAILVMNVETAEIVAYTGNVPSVSTEHGSEVDIITAPRSSGSILKPFLYAGMLESGEITPTMYVQDVPTIMSGYSPKNYNLKYDGMVRANEALSRSLNVPLVRLLTKFGVAKFHYLLRKFAFSTINKKPDHYGLSLILGGAETNLWDLVSAYGVMARGLANYPELGDNVNRKATYFKDLVREENYERPLLNPATTWFTFEAMKEVARPDDDLNWELFSTSQNIAWKTGTSFGFRDAWAVGLNSKYVVGVWVGNADGEGRPGLIGRTAAAPLLFDVFSSLPKADWFYQPFDEMKKVSICKETGYRSSDACIAANEEWIPKTTLNTPPCPYHNFIFLDDTERFQVNARCFDLSKSIKKSWFSLPPIAAYFYENHHPNYQPLPPLYPGCEGSSNENKLAIIYPKKNSQIFIPYNFHQVLEKVVFEATHSDPLTLIHWHLDENYLGSTQRIHQMELTPSTGIHTLSIIDELGNKSSVQFEILLSKNKR